MKSTFAARLVNPPFGDPGLHVSLPLQGTALQFDLGRIDRFPAAELLKLTHVFISHTHIDHFIGFDRIMRMFLARDATLAVYGPPGILANVCGKLAGYTWNLVDGYPMAFEVHEVFPDRIDSARLPAAKAFAVENIGSRPFSGVLCEVSGLAVHCVHLDHKIPSLGFAVQEATHVNVRKDELDRLGLVPGPWINQLKLAIRDKSADDTLIPIRIRVDGESNDQLRSLGELKEQLVLVEPGQRIAYVVDTLFSHANARKIADLARDADVFYCESPFLDEDRHQAVKRYHLTARQAGSLARMAAAKRLEVFHFSSRYEGMGERLYREAADTFRGFIAADEPV